MNEQDTKSADNGEQAPRNPCKAGRRRHHGFGALTLLVAGGLTGAGLVTALGVAAHAERDGHGMGMEMGDDMHGGDHDRRRGEHGGRMKKRVQYMLDEVEATPEQREQVEAVLDDLFEQMREMRGDFGAARGEMVAALTAPVIDRAALEQLRQQQVDTMEARSRLMVAGIADVAEVLTPEQRAEIAEHLRKHGKRH